MTSPALREDTHITTVQASARSSKIAQAISPAAFLAVLVWGAIAPFTKYSLETIPTLAFMAIRMLVATIAVFALLAARRKPIGIERDDLPKFLLAGTVLFALSTLLFTGGLSQTTVANMVILSSTSPLLGAVYRWFFKRERPDRRSLVAMLIGFAGVVIVVSDGSSTEGTSVIGNLMGLASAALWVGVTIYPQPLVRKYGAARATGWMVATSLLLIVPLSLGELSTVVHHPAPPLAWGGLLYAAMGTFVGNALWQDAVQQVGPARTLIYLYLQPFLALLIAAIVLGDRMTPVQVIGGLLAIGGVMLVKKG
ncbi:MAG: DMT family transporter [Thermomicrobiales bacterium]|nr:DMT family transporter [Thermomicrobiales bacterium]